MRATRVSGQHRATWLFISAALLTAWDQGMAESTVYRCTAPDGRIEFRERPCDGRASEQALSIPDNRTGWVPPSPAPADEPEHKSRRDARSNPAADKDPYAERCWRKRQQIQGINNELRAGYQPARGERLKRRRREYEAFVDRYCR